MALAAVNSTLGATAESAALLDAFNSGELGVSFGIAGFLVGYLAGAAYLLLELGIITPATKIAGASSGALLAMGLCSGLEPERFQAIAQQLANTCRARKNCQGQLGDAVASSLESFLPPDAWRRCRNKAYMSITQGSFPSRSPQNKMVSDYSSNADMAAAGAASSYIPLWSGKATSTTFRGMQSYDGFFSNSQPCPPGVKACIKFNSKNPPWDNRNLDAFFKIFARVAHAGAGKPVRLASLPPGTSLEGGNSGSGGASAASSGSSSPAGSVAQAMQQAAAMGVDLAPGIYSPTGMTPEAWEEIIVLPGDEAVNKHLWELGRRDAQIWARATGLEAAAAAKRASYRVYSQG